MRAPLAGAAEIVYDERVRAIGKILPALLLCLGLASCIDIDTRIRFQGDGSGTLALHYRVSHLIVDLGKGGDATRSVPLPIEKEDFDRSLEGVAGVRMTRWDRSEDELDIIIQAEISFDRVESLAQIESFRSSQPTLSVSGTGSTYSQIVLQAEKEPVTDDTLSMLDALFEGYGISFTVEAPSSIRDRGIGTVGSDGRTWSWKTTVKELIQSRTDTVISLSW